MTTQIDTTSPRSFAAIRAHRTRLVARIATCRNLVAKSGLEAALAIYDGQLASAPVKPAKPAVDRRVSALKAHRTRLGAQLKGTRGKLRASIVAKMTRLDTEIAA